VGSSYYRKPWEKIKAKGRQVARRIIFLLGRKKTDGNSRASGLKGTRNTRGSKRKLHLSAEELGKAEQYAEGGGR